MDSPDSTVTSENGQYRRFRQGLPSIISGVKLFAITGIIIALILLISAILITPPLSAIELIAITGVATITTLIMLGFWVAKQTTREETRNSGESL